MKWNSSVETAQFGTFKNEYYHFEFEWLITFWSGKFGVLFRSVRVDSLFLIGCSLSFIHEALAVEVRECPPNFHVLAHSHICREAWKERDFLFHLSFATLKKSSRQAAIHLFTH